MQILTPRQRSGRVALLSILLALASLAPTFATARTWQIQVDGSGDAPTVQAGIDSAAVGDTVLVHPGTYHERITFRGRDIVVRSLSGPEQTILDAASTSRSVVTIESGESRAAVLRGFTLTNGRTGVWILNSQPSIVGNVITLNGPSHDGGGIIAGADTSHPWFPLIKGNVISENGSENLGGGIAFLQRMVPEVLDNYIEGNEAGLGDGGGIYLRSLDDGSLIRGNTIINNHAGDHGGGFYAGNVNQVGAMRLEVSWNLIAGNSAGGRAQTGNSGGGVWISQSQAWVHHNTIVGNTGDGPNSVYGGGIVLLRAGTPIVEKNIIAFSQKGGGIWCGDGATPIIWNNLAWQNAGGDGVGTCATWWQTDGNVVADPYFCNIGIGDHRLAQDSPAITHIQGPFGCYPVPGCGPVAVESTTWGRIKALYR